MNYPAPQKMMSWDEFAVTKVNTPYVFNIKTRDGKEILYYGARHSQDPSDKMFEDIRSRFNNFNPDAVFIEGSDYINNPMGLNEARKMIQSESELDTISKNGGESGFTLRLAFEKNVYVESPEVSYQDQIRHSEESGFSNAAIFVYFITRHLVQLQRYPKGIERPSLEKYSYREFKSLSNIVSWPDIELNFESYKKHFKDIVGRDFDIEDVELKEVVDPSPWPHKKDRQGVTNDVARATSDYRDEYIMRRIATVVNDHSRLFVVFGSAHAIRQERALKAYFSAI